MTADESAVRPLTGRQPTVDRSARRPGVRLGVDPGTKRVGVSRSDPDGLMAIPLETIPAPGDPLARSVLARIAQLVVETGAMEVVVGFPVALDGSHGPAAQAVERFAIKLARQLTPVPVRLVDERLSTARVTKRLREAGHDSRSMRAVVDRVAAAEILQHALDAEAAQAGPPGRLVR